jgi:hypothetical protein
MNALKPIFHQVISELRQRREADAAKKEEARSSATAARRPVETIAGSSPIERFNAANRIADLMLSYGYEPAPSGLDWRSPLQQSGSYASRIYLRDDGSEEFISLSGSDAAAGIGVKTTSGARRGDAFDLYMFYEHKGDRSVALSAWDAEEAKRRQVQREENAQIGSGSDTVPPVGIFSVDELISNQVFIRDGSQVADLNCPLSVLNWGDFKNALAGSKHQVANASGATKLVAATQVWLESPDRKQADTLTFHAGAGLMTRCPKGRRALNIWRPRARGDVPDNWEWRASYFLDHVARLWGADTDPFLDWLAHIEQKPGILPHFGWLHVSPSHGTGRNWVASVLVRLWPGNVAASLDLVGLLDGGFNDRLSCCLLGIVDEVNEGGAQKYRAANRLRQFVTPEFREINPKYGRKRIEHNAARWLIFSNHTGALPLDEQDRRFWVVSHEGQPREASYYVRLYGLLHNTAFIASVREFLSRRDISHFNPGQRPPMNDAKIALVEFSESQEDAVCKALVSKWPVDLMTATELSGKLPGYDPLLNRATRHAMDRFGIRKLRKKVRHAGKLEGVYAIRNHGGWNVANPDQVRAEIDRVTKDEKASAMERDHDD